MAEQILREIWLFQKRRTPPIDIVAGSQIPIALEMKDYTIPSGATVKVYARPWGRETTYVQDATATGNTVVFTPQDGFFQEGWNAVQLEIDGSKIPLALDVNGGVRLSDGGGGATPEAVRPLVARAEDAAKAAVGQAAEAKASADAAEKSAQGIRDSAEKIDKNAEDVNQLKGDLDDYVINNKLFYGELSDRQRIPKEAANGYGFWFGNASKIPVKGGKSISIDKISFTATKKETFTSLFLRIREFDENDVVIKSTVEGDLFENATLSLNEKTAYISVGYVYSKKATVESYNEVFSGYIGITYGNITLSEKIKVPKVEEIDLKIESLEYKQNQLIASDFEKNEMTFMETSNNMNNMAGLCFTVFADSHLGGYGFDEKIIGNHMSVYTRLTENTGASFMMGLGDLLHEAGINADPINDPEMRRKRLAYLTKMTSKGSTPFLYVMGHHELYSWVYDDNKNIVFKYDNQTGNESLPRRMVFGCLNSHIKYAKIRYDNEQTNSPNAIISNYYYVDYDNEKKRLICLNTCSADAIAIDNRQVEWLKAVLNSTPSGYGVIVFGHVAIVPYLNKLDISGVTWKNYSAVIKTLNDYISAGGIVLAYIHGHTHFDNVAWYAEKNDYFCKFPCISICCDLPYKKTNIDVKYGFPISYERKIGDLNEYCLDFMSVTNNTIRIIRFGCGNSRYINVIPYKISVGESITIKPNYINSNTIKLSPEMGLSVDGNTFTGTESGMYVVMFGETDKYYCFVEVNKRGL